MRRPRDDGGMSCRRCPPTSLFWLSLALKMAVTAGFVVVAAMVAERAGPAIGALVATLPIAAGPAYFFVALDHDAAFISRERDRQHRGARGDRACSRWSTSCWRSASAWR